MITKRILNVIAESKDKRIPQIIEAAIDFSEEGVPIEEKIKIIGNEADVAICLKFAELDARINNRRMFPIPEPEPMEEFEEIEGPLTREGK